MINGDIAPLTSESFHTVDGIAGFAQDNKNSYGEDVIFAREVTMRDPIVFSQADHFINIYLSQQNESSVFNTDYAMVITYSPVFYNYYQVIIASDFERSFAVISIGKYHVILLSLV